MSGTPRLRSAYPSTPRTERRPAQRRSEYDSPIVAQRTGGVVSKNPSQSSIPTLAARQSNEPVIPESWIEAPSQRFYAAAVYGLLLTWRFFDWHALQESEEQSLWLFMKWVFLDGIFLFGLPSLRIPWLEWNSGTMLVLFCIHAIVDGILMFQIPIPLGAAFATVGRSIWGAYELAVNEHSVNPSSILHNDSLILGRQVIHILPEGSAVLNPDKEPFCIDASRPEVRLPITINSTNPVSIDLLRMDLDRQANETIHIGKSQIKTMHKEASRMVTYSDHLNEPKTLYISIKKPGLYLLAKVLDETNLEVTRKRLAHTVVVPCPRASVQTLSNDKCRGELSNVALDVVGTPPLRVKYHRMVNQVTQESILDSVQPEEFVTPLAKQDQNALVIPNRIDVEWARTRDIQVPLSEHLGTAGIWAYAVNEVRDGFGNTVIYTDKDQDEQERHQKSAHLHAVIQVHERPVVNLNSQKPLKVAKGKLVDFPIQLGSSGRGAIPDTAYQIVYNFTPDEKLSPTGDHSANPLKKRLTIHHRKQKPQIREAGLYTLSSVSTEFCQGEVLEPASCLLQNPPEPDIVIAKEEIFDKCAGSPIGLRVNLDMIGTPPFDITYSMNKRGERHHNTEHERIDGHRGQIELTPKQAGHYTYFFYEMHDAVYKGHSLRGKNLILEQDVKPSASARFISSKDRLVSCIDEPVQFEIGLRGEGPFSIEYELLHGGRRDKFTVNDIHEDSTTLTTPPLSDGGEYTIALASVTDQMGCKEFLNDELKINVRHQKPKAAFGRIDGLSSVDLLEGKKAQLPLRLVGEAPWTIRYRDSSGFEQIKKAEHANDRIAAEAEGLYELLDINDAICPGIVDEASNKFNVQWIARPEMRVASSDAMERKGGNFVKEQICEGEEDAIELLFKGSAPFAVQYVEQVKPLHGTKAPRTKDVKNLQNVATLRLDTNQAGVYEYKFMKLEDANYDHSPRHFSPFGVQQQVNPRPSAAFTNPGKTYSFCSVESDGEEVIPITLHGTAPFDLELEIRNHGAGKPEMVTIGGIASSHHSIRIPHRSLHPGKSSVSLRRVSDSRGCSRILDSTTPRVQVSVHEPPSIFALENSEDYCVGDRINFGLSGVAPFSVFYTFQGQERKAVVQGSTFRRLAEKPGNFVITGIQDSASNCRANTRISKNIHSMPSARVSKGREHHVDIHEGATTEILFEFGGVPPFEFTYTRSANADKGRKAGAVLDMRSEISDEHSMRIRASEEGTYEVVAIKDRYCAYAKPGVKVDRNEQKKLGY